MNAALAELVAHYAAVRKRIIAGPPKPANVSRPALACQPKPAAPRPAIARMPARMVLSLRTTATGAFGPTCPSPLAGCVWMERKPSPSQIIALAARVAGVTPDELTSARRQKPLIVARQLAIVLLLRHTRLSIKEIGRRLGRRDHTTILHARNQSSAALAGVALPDAIDECAAVAWRVLSGEGR